MWTCDVGLRFLILIILVTSCSSTTTSKSCDEIEKDILKTVSALTKLLDFFVDHTNQISLDGVSGINFGSGFLIQEMDTIKSSTKPNSLLLKALSSLVKKMKIITLKADIHIERKNPKYFNHFWKVATHPLIYSKKFRELRNCPRWTVDNPFKKRSYAEKKGDNCLSNVLITSTPDQEKCKSTASCWNRMVSPCFHAGGYTLTHGLFYLIFMKRYGCKAPPGFNLDDLMHDFCCRVRKDYYKTLNHPLSVLTIGGDDLTLEQAAICTIIGYRGFNSDLLFNHIISRQTTSGCFGAPVSKHRRRLMIDTVMADGCSSHENGLAATFLSLRLRVQIEELRRICAK